MPVQLSDPGAVFIIDRAVERARPVDAACALKDVLSMRVAVEDDHLIEEGRCGGGGEREV